MNKDYQEVIRDMYKNLSLIEDFHLIKQCFVDLEKFDSKKQQEIVEAYLKKITNSEFKESLKDYVNDIKKAGLFNNKVTILSTKLINLYFINAKILSQGNSEFAEKIIHEKFIKDACTVMAKDLLNGHIDVGSKLAAEEASKIRKELVSTRIELDDMKEKNNFLSMQVAEMKTALTNIGKNLKEIFTFTDKEIDLLKFPNAANTILQNTNDSETQTAKRKPFLRT